ncbi:MAG: oligosaccharide flippase family protein [Komarekiella atlantica HA4396-MV6]|jgi:PST family polysaccharide transporter|nr:oligosaccharide flippase family protein [Komarekiella atlantica HA4396-MV6]
MGLRHQALKGGFIMLIRQGLGILLSLVGVILITRVIGPTEYGLFGASSGIVIFFYRLAPSGLDAYLLRKKANPEQHEYNQVFTLLLCINLICVLGLVLGRQMIAQLLRLPEVAPLVGILALTIPLSTLNLPWVVKLERDLNYQRIAYIELLSQISYYLVAVPLALHGYGAWSPVLGLFTQQACQLSLNYFSSKLRLRLSWNPDLIRTMLEYGLSYASSIWVWELRTLVNPVIVGRFAGAEAVAFVALCVRLVEMLSFAKTVTWRLAMVALPKLGDDKTRIRKSIQEGMRLQVLAVGLPMAGFSLVAPVVLTLVFGKNWYPVLQVLPFIAISYLSHAIFNLHRSVLYLECKNLQVTWFHLVHVALFAGSAFLLVPRLGMIGYGLAEICALASYFILHLYTVREVGNLNYTEPLVWYIISVTVLILSAFSGSVRYLSCLLLLLPLTSTKERNNLVGYFKILKS